MKALKASYLIYDGSCTCCSRLRRALRMVGAATSEDFLAYQELPENFRSKVDRARYRNEIALVYEDNAPTRYGTDALLCAIDHKFPLFSRLFRLPGMDWAARIFYKLISYNRQELAMPRLRPAQCEFSPDLHRGYRLGLWALCALFASLLTALAGGAVGAGIHGLTYGSGALLALALCGPGWLLQGQLGFGLLMRRKKPGADWPAAWAYGTHLAMLMALGTLWLVPIILWHSLAGPVPAWLPLLCVACSFTWMAAAHWLRAHSLGLGASWTVLWALSLFTGAALGLILAMPGEMLRQLF